MSCEICGGTKNLIKHHVSYNPEITQFLCRDCHQMLHKHDLAPKKPKHFHPHLANFKIDEDLWREAKIYCVKNNETLSGLVEKLLEKEVRKKEG